jgi:hypothetical protein
MKATSMEIFGVILMLISAHFGEFTGTDWNCETGLIGTGTSTVNSASYKQFSETSR